MKKIQMVDLKSQYDKIKETVNNSIQEVLDTDRLQIEKNNEIKIELSTNQQEVFNSIKNYFTKQNIGLLNGITGSGKTEIYSKLIH
jgi:primosomal protein N'